MGHDKAADRLIDEAKKMVIFDDEGLIVMQLYSAWLKGDTEIVHGYLGDLAEVDIHLARATAYHLMIDTQGLELPLGPGSSDDRYAWIDGYA